MTRACIPPHIEQFGRLAERTQSLLDSAPRFRDGRWPPVPGRYRVALYKGNFAASPVIYERAASYEHKTLKAAARRLAHMIARQSRRGYSGERFDSLYIVTPEGERLPLRAARERIAANAI